MEALNYEGNGLGGICKLRIIDVDDVPSMPDAINGIISTAVGDSGDWLDLPLQTQSAEANERQVDESGSAYPFLLTVILRRLSAAKHKTLYDKSYKRFLLDYTDLTGNRRLIGTKEEPVAMRLPRNETRRMAKDSPEYQVSFVCATRREHPYYTPG